MQGGGILNEEESRELLKRSDEALKTPDGSVICNRCHQLRNQGQLVELEEETKSEIKVGEP